jgi:hypothetical protein
MPIIINGLDLGQASDPTALAMLEQIPKPGGNRYICRGLRQFHLGTPYFQQAEQLRVLAKTVPSMPGSVLVVDHTAVGIPVLEIFRNANLPFSIWGITITGGNKVSMEEFGNVHVPKKHLVGSLVSVFQSKRLEFAPSAHAAILVKELQNFKIKLTTTGNEQFEHWREGDHDDLVLAVAMAVWFGENFPCGTLDDAIGLSPKTEVARAPEGVFASIGQRSWRAEDGDE